MHCMMNCEINSSCCVSIERIKTKRNDVIQMSLTYENAIARKNARRARLNNKRTRALRRVRVEKIATHIERAYVAQTRHNDTRDVVRDIENALIDVLNAH